MIIRPVSPDDIPSIAAIYGRSVETEFASFELSSPTSAEMQDRMETITASGFPYLVAQIGETIAGYAYASSYRPRPAYKSTVENTVYVSPDFHRKGVGSALLTALIEECRQKSFKQMIGIVACKPDVDPQSMASIALHMKHGFDIGGRLNKVGFKNDLWLDTVLLQRSLAD